MNTTEIGNNFEEKAYNIINEELINNRFLVIPKYCKIYRKKGYFSKDRNKDIIFDISIEIYLPSQNKFSLLIVIECKKYKNKISVDDVEEFYAKLLQISGANIKGIMISSNSMQESAFNFANSKGIGFIKLLDDNKLQWILTRTSSWFIANNNSVNNITYIKNALLNENIKNDNIEYFCNIDNELTISINQFLNHYFKEFIANYKNYTNIDNIINANKIKREKVKFIPKEKIEIISINTLKLINYIDNEVSISTLCKYLELNYDIQFLIIDNLGLDSYGNEILGKISFNPTIISISQNNNNDIFRQKFTVAHELGHYFLNHVKYLKMEYYTDKNFDNDNITGINNQEIKWMEWQANYFASSLLLPKNIFVYEVNNLIKELELIDRGHGKLYVDDQKCNLDNYYLITNKLKHIFRVSRKVIEIRLKNLDILIDERTNTKINFNLNNSDFEFLKWIREI